MVDDRIQALGFQGGEDAVPWRGLQFDLDAQLLGQRLRQLDLETAELAAFVDKAERWVSAFETDLDLTGFLDVAQLFAGHGLAQPTSAEGQAQCADQQCATEYRNSHEEPLCCYVERSR